MGWNDGTDLKKMTLSNNKYKILILDSKNQLSVYNIEKIAFYDKKTQEILVSYKLTIKQSSKILAPKCLF